MQKAISENSHPSEPARPDQNGNNIELGEIISTLRGNKRLILLITAALMALGLLKVFLDTPVYQTDALLKVEANSKEVRPIEKEESVKNNEIQILAEVELISSRLILGQAIENLRLNIIGVPKYFPLIGKVIASNYQANNKDNKIAEPLLGLSEYAWGGESIKVDNLSVPVAWQDKPLTLVAEEGGKFRLLFEDKLILNGEVGRLASKQIDDWQNSFSIFVSKLNSRPGVHFKLIKESENTAITELKNNLSVAEKGKFARVIELTLEANDPLSAVQLLNEIINIYLRQNVDQKSAEAEKKLEFMEKQMPLMKEALEKSTEALNEYKSRIGSIDLDKETQSILDGVVKNKVELTQLQQTRDSLRQKFTESHPSVVAIDKQIARLQEQMNSSGRKIEVLPKAQQEILRLSRDVKVNNDLYTALLNNSQTLRVAKAGAVGDVRVIDFAAFPTEPVKPKKALIIALSTILGLMLGIGFVLGRKLWRGSVDNADLIEKRFQIPVYATIPHSSNQEYLSKKLKREYGRIGNEPVILGLQHKDDLAIESLRSLRTSLHFAGLEAHNNIIMVTGPSPGVGKTFVAINLAIVMADAGKKILLIDGDMRKGYINKILGVGRENGLSEIISNSILGGEPLLGKAIQRVEIANLDFIPTGVLPPNPSELLLHEKIGPLLENIGRDYDHVIIDSPPILAVSDALIIGRMASAAIMVLKAGQHTLREIEQTLKKLERADVQLKGVVFNDLPESSFRYGDNKYAYQYGLDNVA